MGLSIISSIEWRMELIVIQFNINYMKILQWTSIVAMVASIVFFLWMIVANINSTPHQYTIKCKPNYKIVKLVTDERGLISFTYVDFYGEEYGYDYITVEQFNRILWEEPQDTDFIEPEPEQIYENQ